MEERYQPKVLKSVSFFSRQKRIILPDLFFFLSSFLCLPNRLSLHKAIGQEKIV